MQCHITFKLYWQIIYTHLTPVRSCKYN